MINTGKCPKCEKRVSNVQVESVDVREGFASTWRGIYYCCPHCKAILGVQIDPIAIMTDTVSKIIEKLKKEL